MAVVWIYTHDVSAAQIELRTELRFEWVRPQVRPLKFMPFYRIADRLGSEGEYLEWVHGNRDRAQRWGLTIKS